MPKWGISISKALSIARRCGCATSTKVSVSGAMDGYSR